MTTDQQRKRRYGGRYMTIPDQVDGLTRDQKQRLDRLTNLHTAMDSALDQYAEYASQLNNDGMSWGLIGFWLELPKEVVWRSVQRWKQRRKG